MNQILFSFFYRLAHKSSALDALLVFIAQDLIWIVLIALFFYLLKLGDKRKAIRDIIVVFGAAGVGIVAATVLKNLFNTLRPFVELPSVQSLITESGNAFPSGHTTLLFALAGALWRDYRGTAILVGIIGLFVGLSRIAVGVHWPIDILGGALLGSAIGVGAYLIAQRFGPRQ